jgi:hypothetical protein
MKKKLLQIVTLVLFSVGSVHIMFSVLLAGDTSKLLPSKIAPQTPSDQYAPQQQNKYSPKELNRIYLFEKIHKSIERGKRGIPS